MKIILYIYSIFVIHNVKACSTGTGTGGVTRNIHDTWQSMIYEQNSSLTVTCHSKDMWKIDTNNIKINLLLQYDNKRYKLDIIPDTLTLTIPSLRINDAGLYMCGTLGNEITGNVADIITSIVDIIIIHDPLVPLLAYENNSEKKLTVINKYTSIKKIVWGMWTLLKDNSIVEEQNTTMPILDILDVIVFKKKDVNFIKYVVGCYNCADIISLQHIPMI